MANTKSALKRIRTSERKRQRNQAIRSKVKTMIKKANMVLTAPEAESMEAIRAAVKALDQAAAKGVIHKNNAARRKARLMRKYNIAHGIGSRTTVKD
ncbi:MAG: 30S ribosomal protein S20 [Herpetosiphonaceae bacterium]|nr:MAG: 30S ribosomal protein S20 [Herpetosiphonaceae bacterium]